ncbi:H-type small acid-soluble spore protein [Paenibacillus sp. GCM10028914]|uniref:H-type small acid-soluble spore protein n=1 Tax=Paenibacillus sp. GCM10028914 TaxID=3273416 RepID=UPI003617F9B0
MEMERAVQIFKSEDTFKVKLEGEPVWIEQIDPANGMATVQVGSRPTNTVTVNVERLEEGE